MIRRHYHKILRILLPLVFLFSGACETRHGPLIPYVRVYMELDIYAELGGAVVPGTFEYPDEGYHGVALYTDGDFNFWAYDLTCTQYPQHDSKLTSSDSIFDGIYNCPVCGSRYLLELEGYPIEGPAQYPLVPYKTSRRGNVVVITN